MRLNPMMDVAKTLGVVEGLGKPNWTAGVCIVHQAGTHPPREVT